MFMMNGKKNIVPILGFFEALIWLLAIGQIFQNIDNPLSLFETTADKLSSSGYIRVSQTPYIDLDATTPKRRKAVKKPTRCPLTLDFLEDRADSERPAPILPDLFS
jgi:hypothetical protein